MMTKKTSQNGVNFIAAWEKFIPNPYYATNAEKERGIRTWGFGHTGADVPNFGTIRRDDALKLLAQDLKKSEDAVNKWAHPSINQAQFDALVDHVFNNGDGSIRADNVANDFDDMVRGGNWEGVRKHILDFKNQRQADGTLKPMLGLIRRTTGRQALFDGKTAADAEAIGRAVK